MTRERQRERGGDLRSRRAHNTRLSERVFLFFSFFFVFFSESRTFLPVNLTSVTVTSGPKILSKRTKKVEKKK